MLTLLRSPSKKPTANKVTTETVVWQSPSPLKNGFKIPAAVYVRNDGRYVVLRDQYSRLGYGTVLAFLNSQGQALQTYTLEDLFTVSEITDMPHSVSSIHWSQPGMFRFTDAGNRFGFITDTGSIGLFDVATGKRLPFSAPETTAFRAEVRRIARHDLSTAADGDVYRGTALVGILKDREAVPALTHLTIDPSQHLRIINGRKTDPFSVQFQAGNALVRILGAKATPLLEARLTRADSYMTTVWIDLIGQAGTAHQSAAVLKATQSRDPDVRNAAIKAVIQNGGAAVIRKHPAWVNDRSENVRYNVIRSLADSGDSRDLPILRRAVSTTDEEIHRQVLRGLIRLKAPDLDTILRRSILTHPDNNEARFALADRGDDTQLRWCLSAVSRFVDTWQSDHETDEADIDSQDRIISMGELQKAAQVLAQHPPEGTEATLRKITTLSAETDRGSKFFECTGFGGLAALGDSAALQNVRALAASTDPIITVSAIEWLAICRDHSSVPLLRSLLNHRETIVRKAAQKALATMSIPEAEKAMTSLPNVIG